ncbi:MAG: hypothetical protein JWQ71_4650 [Pedosphaera sp.]|nr:hypothetical protein [Pedosphaera sp.]
MHRLLYNLIIAMCVWIAVLTASADAPYGLNNRHPVGEFLNTNLPPATPDASGGWMTVPAFPNLTFDDPTFLTCAPGTNLLYVCTRQGIVWFFENDPAVTNKTIFLNLTNRNQGYDDCGLLGMAFHPEFGQPASTNRGYVYIYYQYTPTPTNPWPTRPVWTTPTYNRLSRFTVPDDSLVADPDSEQVLINQFDQHLWHNGGGMFFGSDGFLYLSNGDEGGSDDVYRNTQKINKALFSGVLRIDVNQDPTKSHPILRQPEDGVTPPIGWPPSYSSNYFIPNDNPFINPDGSVLEEFFAIGFRSPHRMTFDPPSGQIWLGDVGDGGREEVDLIVKGGNYQWAYAEGINPGPAVKPFPLIGTEMPPVYDYPHFDTNGNFTGSSCVIGGYVYRGSQFAGHLAGKLIFGDNVSGRISALTYNGTNPPTVTYLCTMPGAAYEGLSSFGLDQNNEIYMCQMGVNGQIFKLALNGVVIAPPPTLLSQTGVFTNLIDLSPVEGLIPYNVNSPLWSDGALKSRWLAVPNNGEPYAANQQIGFSATGEWTFPIGTVFVKHFELEVDETNPAVKKRLETRLLVHGTNDTYYGLTYKWRADNSDADLLTNSLNEDIVITTATGTRTQTWYYPSRQDCMICHNPNANFVLGVKTRQLNGDFIYPETGTNDNQLRALNHVGLFNPALDESLIPSYASMVHVTNTSASLDTRMRSYLDANCAQCHRPNGVVQANFDARFDTPLINQGIINGTVGNTLGITGAKVVAPSDVNKSIMHSRLNTTGANKMPPLARSIIDTNAVATLQAWINSFVSPSITTQPESQTVNPGFNVIFSVVADGTGPLNYQWKHNSLNIAGATNSTYTVNLVQPTDVGSYTVAVSSPAGTVVSSNAVLTLTGPPTIVSQPQTQGVLIGANVAFNVLSSGTPPLNYQWRFEGSDIVGATASSYSFNNAQLTNGGSYSVVITNMYGSTVSSDAVLFVNIPAPTSWSDQDVGDTFIPGYSTFTNGTFDVVGSGNDIWGDTDGFHFVYQPLNDDGAIVAQVLHLDDTDPWAKTGVMIRETLAQNSAHAFMAISAENGASFQRRVTNGGLSDASTGPSVAAPYWVKLVRATNTFTGYTSEDGTNWVAVDDVTIDMTNNVYIGLAVTAHNNGDLNVGVFNNVEWLQSITVQPQSKLASQGASATFNVVASGSPLNYQWCLNGTNIPGAIGSSYTITNAQPTDAGSYSVVITNLAGTLISSSAFLTLNVTPVNVPPVLAPIPDQTIHAQSLLSLVLTAGDLDTPTNLLSFSLDLGTSAGAQINTTNGLFTWTPTDTQVGTNQFTVRVTDDGTPGLSDTKTFNVNVVPRPAFQSANVASGNITLGWNAIAGQTYRLQYKTNLDDSAWLNVPGDVLATSPAANKIDSVGSDTQRFYRIILLP